MTNWKNELLALLHDLPHEQVGTANPAAALGQLAIFTTRL